MKALELSGKKFGKLTVLYRDYSNKGQSKWVCQCDCGSITKPISGTYLVRGHTTSCGCHRKEVAKAIQPFGAKANETHTDSKSRLYKIWWNMKTRCYNQSNHFYPLYGGRGITICDEWKNSYSDFKAWAIENGYRDDLTIDRMDVNGNYEPANCKWSTRKEQSNNTRKTRMVTLYGETAPIMV